MRKLRVRRGNPLLLSPLRSLGMDRISLPAFWGSLRRWVQGAQGGFQAAASAAASLRKSKYFFLANPKNRSASTKWRRGWVFVEGKWQLFDSQCCRRENGSIAPAVGTDGSAAVAAADHGCLLVVVWLQCGTTTIYTYMNTFQLQSKIKSSPQCVPARDFNRIGKWKLQF